MKKCKACYAETLINRALVRRVLLEGSGYANDDSMENFPRSSPATSGASERSIGGMGVNVAGHAGVGICGNI